MARGIFRVVWLISLLWAFGMFISCGAHSVHDIQIEYSIGDGIFSLFLSHLPPFELFKTVFAYAVFGVGPGLLMAKASNWAMRRLEY